LIDGILVGVEEGEELGFPVGPGVTDGSIEGCGDGTGVSEGRSDGGYDCVGGLLGRSDGEDVVGVTEGGNVDGDGEG